MLFKIQSGVLHCLDQGHPLQNAVQCNPLFRSRRSCPSKCTLGFIQFNTIPLCNGNHFYSDYLNGLRNMERGWESWNTLVRPARPSKPLEPWIPSGGLVTFKRSLKPPWKVCPAPGTLVRGNDISWPTDGRRPMMYQNR
jgi:hypothetical protein